MRFSWVLPLVFVSCGALAQGEEELKGELKSLQAVVALLNLEQQALYQQFQMIQELRRTNREAFFSGGPRSPQYATDIPSYADLVQYQNDVARRGNELADEAARIYAQYAEIGNRKTQLQQRIYELTAPKP